MPLAAFAALLLALTAALAAAAPAPPRLVLPYDVERDAAGRVFIADGGRHQVLRWDARRRRVVVVAGTGARGTSGDGGPARRARLDEVAGLAFDRRGNLYVSDVHNGRVRRIDRAGVITTVARVPAAAGISVDRAGRSLAIASLDRGVVRVDLASGAVETLAPVGTAGVENPHGVAYDARGALWIADPAGRVLRIPAGARTPEVVAALPAFDVVPMADGSVLAVSGNPDGGRIRRIAADGTVTPVAGTGRLSAHRDGVRATRAGILPSDVAAGAGGTLLVAQTEPVAALRVIRGGRIETLFR